MTNTERKTRAAGSVRAAVANPLVAHLPSETIENCRNTLLALSCLDLSSGFEAEAAHGILLIQNTIASALKYEAERASDIERGRHDD